MQCGVGFTLCNCVLRCLLSPQREINQRYDADVGNIMMWNVNVKNNK